LKNVTISEGVESIGVLAFSSCKSLESITIPQSVMNIGIHAFQECANLSEVYFEETTPPTFGCPTFACYYSESKKITFYFKNSSVYDSFTTSYYNSSNGFKRRKIHRF
jgi:hypothetical protein